MTRTGAGEPGTTQRLYARKGKSFYPLYGEVHISKNHSTKADRLQKKKNKPKITILTAWRETIILFLFFFFFEMERVYLQISSKRGNF